MDIKIDEIVKQVLAEMDTSKAANEKTAIKTRMPELTGRETAKAAFLEKPEQFCIKNMAIPKLGEKDILVRMEGCMISPSDVAEFIKERRSGGNASIGMEGTGQIVKLGSEGLKDTAGNTLQVGDYVISVKKTGFSSIAYTGKQETHGWFTTYLVLRSDMQVCRVNGLDLESRLLVSAAAAVNQAVERTIRLCRLDSSSTAVVLGCGMEGLLASAVLKCHGIDKIVAVDHEEQMNRAYDFGASDFIGAHGKNGISGVQERLKKLNRGLLADAVFNCTVVPVGRSAARRLVKDSGSVCELGYVLGKGRSSAQYFEEGYPSSGRFYSNNDYEKCLEFLRKAMEKKLPLYKLITHRYHLEEINEAMWTCVREEGLGVAVFNR